MGAKRPKSLVLQYFLVLTGSRALIIPHVRLVVRGGK